MPGSENDIVISSIHSRRSKRGFTLIETCVSMYLLLVGVLVFAGMAVFANKIGLQAKLRTSAYQIARQQVEALKSTNFDNLVSVAETPFDIPEEVIRGLPGGDNAKYEVTGAYKVEDRNSSTKSVTVRIKWRNASSPEGRIAPWSEVRLATILVRPGSVTAPGAPLPSATPPPPPPTLPPAPTGSPTGGAPKGKGK